MPLDPGNPYYRRENVPDSIDDLIDRLCTHWRRPKSAGGAKGNLVHYSGYHRSRLWILNSPDSSRGSRDYSVQLADDKAGDGDDVCAFDFTPGEWGTPENRRRMVEITTRMYEAAKRNDPRIAHLREFAGTIDGRTVITFDCRGGAKKDPFDESHLDHVHGSIRRRYARNNHVGVYEVMAGIEAPAPLIPGDAMYLFTKQGSGVVGLTTGMEWRWVTAAEYPHIVALHNEGTQPLTFNGQIRELAFWPGECQGTRPDGVPVPVLEAEILAALPHLSADLDDADIAALAQQIIDDADTPFSAEQYDQLVSAATAGANAAEDA